MKILMLAPLKSNYVVQLVNRLASEGNEVFVGYCNDHQPEPDVIDESITLCPLPYPSGIGYFLNKSAVKMIIKKIQPDVINAHIINGYGYTASRAKAKPLLLTAWTNDLPMDMRSEKTLVKNMKHVQFVSAINSEVMSWLGKAVDLSAMYKYILPIGVDIHKYSKKNVERDDNIIIGYMRNFEEPYRQEDALHAVAKLISNLKAKGSVMADKVKLYLFGTGVLRDYLASVVDELELDDVVSFFEEFDETQKVDILSGLDIYLTTSIDENLATYVYEAVSCSLPVVASRLVPHEAVVTDGVNGYLVDAGDIDMYAEKLELLLDSDNRSKMQLASRKIAEEKLDLDICLDESMQAFKEFESNL